MPFELDTNVDLARARNVTLGGRELKVAPLTLRSIMRVSDMLAGAMGAEPGTSASAMLDRLLDFVLLGLARTYPSLTREDLLDSDTTAAELRAAIDVICEQAGAKQKKDDPEGETEAAALSVVGAGSSPGSALN